MDHLVFGLYHFVSLRRFCLCGLFCRFWYIFRLLSGFILHHLTRALRDGCATPRNLHAQKNCATDCQRRHGYKRNENCEVSSQFQGANHWHCPRFRGQMLLYHTPLYPRCNTLGQNWLWLWGWKKAVEITWCENHPCFSVCRCGIPRQRHCKFSKPVWTVEVRKSTPPLSYQGGFTCIEHGIRVTEFTSLDRDLPRKVVTQGLEICSKYTGRPITCYRCESTEHVVKNCPKQPSCFNHTCGGSCSLRPT